MSPMHVTLKAGVMRINKVNRAAFPLLWALGFVFLCNESNLRADVPVERGRLKKDQKTPRAKCS